MSLHFLEGSAIRSARARVVAKFLNVQLQLSPIEFSSRFFRYLMTYPKTDSWHAGVLHLKTFRIKISHDKRKSDRKMNFSNKFQPTAEDLCDCPPNLLDLFSGPSDGCKGLAFANKANMQAHQSCG